MEKMESYRRASQPQFPTPWQRRSRYEPSDSETEWQESPWVERNRNNGNIGLRNPHSGLDRIRNKSPLKLNGRSFSRYEDEPFSQNGDLDQTRKKSPLKLSRRPSSGYEGEPISQNGELSFEKADFGSNQTGIRSPFKLSLRQSAKFEDKLSSRARASEASPPRRRHSKSPYKLPREDTPFQNVSPFAKTEVLRHASPYKPVREGYDLINNGTVSLKRLENCRQTNNVSNRRGGYDQMVSEKSSFSHRSQSAPRPIYGRTEENSQRTPSPLPGIRERGANHRNTLSVGELNEMVANTKIAKAPTTGSVNFESTDSISQGDIFFSKEYTTMKMTTQNNVFLNKDNGRNYVPPHLNIENGSGACNNQRNSSTMVTKRTTTTSNSSFSRQSSDKLSTTTSGKLSATSVNTERFMANRKKGQAEPWFSCLKSGTCKSSKSRDKVKEFDEAAFIAKAFVVEILRQFWADKHQPASLDGFTCHKQEAQLLKQLVSNDTCPHILLKGPPGSGKRALTMALLREIFGDSAWNISHELRYFCIQKSGSMQVAVRVPCSAHHVELNAYAEPNVRYALISLVKEISSNFALTPEVSLAIERTDFKVIVLYDVDKAAESIQHLIKWIMDCYTDSCKLVLCCEDDEGILEPVGNRCKLVKVDAPVTHEIMEVLLQIARKENFDLPMNFAAKIANKSRQNLRHAVMALEACKAHNYPFVDDQPIPLGWEEVVERIAAEILADPSHTRIFAIRGSFQKLLVEFVHPKLILQGLVERFLKAVDGRSKRELYYWHAYYEKRLPIGTSALLKLEEFVAKFMSIHRRGTLINRNNSASTK